MCMDAQAAEKKAEYEYIDGKKFLACSANGWGAEYCIARARKEQIGFVGPLGVAYWEHNTHTIKHGPYAADPAERKKWHDAAKSHTVMRGSDDVKYISVRDKIDPTAVPNYIPWPKREKGDTAAEYRIVSCSRNGCERVMCDRHSVNYGYICNECFDALVRMGPGVNIGAFMNSIPGPPKPILDAWEEYSKKFPIRDGHVW